MFGTIPIVSAYAYWIATNPSHVTGDGAGGHLVADAAGNLHLSAIDTVGHVLKYFRRTGTTWTVQVVDSVDVTANTAIAVDASGVVHVSYYKSGGLMYARLNNGTWSTAVVDSVGIASSPFTGIAVDVANRPHISYWAADTAALKYASWTGGVWSTQIVDAESGTGYFNSLVLDSSGNPHISYAGTGSVTLKLADWTGSAWSTRTLAAHSQSPNSIAIDSSDHLYVAYSDESSGTMITLTSRTTGGWSTSVVVPGTKPTLTLGSDGLPQIAYVASVAYALPLHARWTGSQWFNTAPFPSWVLTPDPPTLTVTPNGNYFLTVDELNNQGDRVLWLGEWDVDSTPPVGSPSVPAAPTFLSTTTLTFTWTQGSATDPESGIGGYYLQVGTATATNNASFFDADVGGVTGLSMSGARNGMTYYARVRARNGQFTYGTYSAFSSGTTIDISTPAAPTSLTSGSHPDSTTPYPFVRPRFALSGPAKLSGIVGYRWKVDGSPNTTPTSFDPLGGTAIQTTDLLADGTYYFHAVAQDGAGNIGTSAAHYKFIVKATVDPAVDTTFAAGDGMSVTFPAGALIAAAQLDIHPVASVPASKGPDVALSAAVRDLRMTDGTSHFQKGITLTLPYAPADIAGITESSLRLFYYDTGQQTWVLVPNSRLDTVGRTVTAVVDHFTLFALAGFAPAAGPLDRLTNYPNPFSPLRGQVTRIRYALDADRSVRLRIYDPFGRLVADQNLSGGGPGGRVGPNEVVWDGRAGDGRLVEMGGYICVVESGGTRQVVKIGVK